VGSRFKADPHVLSVERQEDGATIVTVLPITHSAPTRPGAAVEIPAPVKRHLGLDEQLLGGSLFTPSVRRYGVIHSLSTAGVNFSDPKMNI
jgi:hypothetical protein